MIALLQWFIYGHVCKWKRTALGPFEKYYDGELVRTGTVILYECEKCGRTSKRYIY